MKSFLFPKAYFNWLRLKYQDAQASSLTHQGWEIENYRNLSVSELLNRLNAFSLHLSSHDFIKLSQPYTSPEELTQNLFPNQESPFKGYLIIFELWRRLIPNKISLSICGDEFDHQIDQYYQNSLEAEIAIEGILEHFMKILESNIDEGVSIDSVFNFFKRHLAHNLEEFLYDFISDQIHYQKYEKASELLHFVSGCGWDTNWIHFLKAQILISEQEKEGNEAFKELLDSDSVRNQIDLLLEITAFLVHHGCITLFQQACFLTLKELGTEEDFQDLLAILIDYCDSVNQDKELKCIKTILSQRSNKNLSDPVASEDPDRVFFQNCLMEIFHFSS